MTQNIQVVDKGNPKKDTEFSNCSTFDQQSFFQIPSATRTFPPCELSNFPYFP